MVLVIDKCAQIVSNAWNEYKEFKKTRSAEEMDAWIAAHSTSASLGPMDAFVRKEQKGTNSDSHPGRVSASGCDSGSSLGSGSGSASASASGSPEQKRMVLARSV